MIEHIRIEDLVFEVRRSSRRRTIGLTVDRSGKLLVYSPEGTSTAELEQWTRSKLLWVYQKLALKEEIAPRVPAPLFVTGESFRYLGRSYQLKMISRQNNPLSFDGRRFYLRRDAKDSAPDQFRQWYITKGKEWLQKRVALLAKRVTVAPKRIDVRDLGYRWGSCGQDGTIYFNWKAMQLPVRVIDYLVIHEMLHLREPRHGERFWKHLDSILPDWPKRKEELLALARDIHLAL